MCKLNMLQLLMYLVIECSGNKLPLRIFGGNDSKPDDYTNVVRIETPIIKSNKTNNTITKHHHLCTGSAISSTWVLTAAHCLVELKLVIRYGHVRNSPGMNDSFSDVLLTIANPLYTLLFKDLPRDTIMKNDVGLIKTTPMNMKSYMKLSAVDYMTMFGHEAVSAGFGITSTTRPGGKIKTGSTLKLKKPLQVLKVLISKCYLNKLVPAFCLARRCDNRVSVCPGDSGGPLIHASGLVGVTSLGERTSDCLFPVRKRAVNVAGFVVPISPYIEWINSYVIV